MEEEINLRINQLLDLEIINSYNAEKNQVLIKLTPRLFNKIAGELL
jgi:hypothetical protein